MHLRQFIQSVLGLVFLVISSFALSNTEFTYNVIDGGIEVTGCVDECPSDLVIPEEIDGYSVISIGEYAFHTKELISLVIPNSTQNIGKWAFTYNHLVNLTIPERIEWIGANAFRGNQLTSVYFVGNLPNMNHSPFADNPGISFGEFRYISLGDGAVIMGCTGTCPTDIAIPEEIDGFIVTGIEGNAFEDRGLTSVTIPNSVTVIGGGAFAYNQLTNLTFPSGLNLIGDYAFHSNNLSTINIPNGLSSIFAGTFSENQLISVSIPDSVNFIDAAAFRANQLSSILFLGEPPVFEGNPFSENPLMEVFYCQNASNEWNITVVEGITPQLDESCDNPDSQYATFDIDQSGSVDALSDGLILLRYFFGLRGDALINNVISPDANRMSAADIEAYIESHMP